jgi:hypothetical protein
VNCVDFKMHGATVKRIIKIRKKYEREEWEEGIV